MSNFLCRLPLLVLISVVYVLIVLIVYQRLAQDTKTDCAHRFPAQFEYGKFMYVDSGRVEPRIAYTPTNTPPKTPQIPRYENKPFKQPNYVDGTWEFPLDQEAFTGRMPASQIPIGGYSDPSMPSSATMVDVDDDLGLEREVRHCTFRVRDLF